MPYVGLVGGSLAVDGLLFAVFHDRRYAEQLQTPIRCKDAGGASSARRPAARPGGRELSTGACARRGAAEGEALSCGHWRSGQLRMRSP